LVQKGKRYIYINRETENQNMTLTSYFGTEGGKRYEKLKTRMLRERVKAIYYVNVIFWYRRGKERDKN